MQIAPTFRGWIKAANPTSRDLLEASFYVRSELRIPQHAWGQACGALGQTEAVAMIAAIAATHEAGAVKSPGAALPAPAPTPRFSLPPCPRCSPRGRVSGRACNRSHDFQERNMGDVRDELG